MPLSRLSRVALPAMAVLLVLAACSERPDLESTITDAARDAPWPDLVPLEPLLAASAPPRERTGAPETGLAARRDRLQQRAQRLNAAVVDADTRSRMRAGVRPLPPM